jgi:rRNA large subunit m3Psi methyltransferase RlmH
VREIIKDIEDVKGDLVQKCETIPLVFGINRAKNIVFLIGGAFGVSEAVFKRADYKWSLSPLVFPHQLVRLILAEQIYRACSINRNEKYHHV